MSRLSTKQRRAARRRHGSGYAQVHRTAWEFWRSSGKPPLSTERIEELLKRAWRALSESEGRA